MNLQRAMGVPLVVLALAMAAAPAGAQGDEREDVPNRVPTMLTVQWEPAGDEETIRVIAQGTHGFGTTQGYRNEDGQQVSTRVLGKFLATADATRLRVEDMGVNVKVFKRIKVGDDYEVIDEIDLEVRLDTMLTLGRDSVLFESNRGRLVARIDRVPGEEALPEPAVER